MSVVYFLRRADDTGPIKIGCTAWPEERRKQLSMETRAECRILASAPGDRFTERNIHLKFAALNETPEWAGDRPYSYGGATEWFAAEPELLAFIEDVKRLGIVPLAEDERREKVIARRYLAGETLRAIGDDFGITRERVRQILRQQGVPSLGWRSNVMRWAVSCRADRQPAET